MPIYEIPSDPPASPGRVQPITIYGTAENLALLNPSADIKYVPVEGMDLEPGTTCFTGLCHNGLVFIGTLACFGSPLTPTYINATYHVFNPGTREWTVMEIATDAGKTGDTGAVDPDDGFGSGNIQVFGIIDDVVVGFPAVQYKNWEIAEYGQYWNWLATTPEGFPDYDTSLTTDGLRANADDPVDAEIMWPDRVNDFAETYAYNQSMARGEPLPNGWFATANYFSTAGTHSGIVAVIDEAQHLKCIYQIPDMAVGAEALTMAPKFLYVDPSATDPTDMRVVINYDVYEVDGSVPIVTRFFNQEFTIDAVGLTIAPTSAPWTTRCADETPALVDYRGKAGGQFDAQGNFWAHASSDAGFGFSQLPMFVFLKTGGERKWVAEAPLSVGWEDNAGVPLNGDFELGAIKGSAQVETGHFEDPISGGHVLIGHGGRISPLIPDDPFVVRPTILPNGSFTSDVTGWNGFGITCTLAWEATDGGRMKITATGSANVVVQTNTTSTYQALPADSEGQSLWAWMRVKAAATSRKVRLRISFVDDDDAVVHAVDEFGPNKVGPERIEVVGEYVLVTAATEVPVGATKCKVWLDIGITETPAASEIHYTDETYLALAPVTHLRDYDMVKAALPVEGVQGRWPGGGASTIDAVDEDRYAYLPIQLVEHDDDLVQPHQMAMYLLRLHLPSLLEVD